MCHKKQMKDTSCIHTFLILHVNTKHFSKPFFTGTHYWYMRNKYGGSGQVSSYALPTHPLAYKSSLAHITNTSLSIQQVFTGTYYQNIPQHTIVFTSIHYQHIPQHTRLSIWYPLFLLCMPLRNKEHHTYSMHLSSSYITVSVDIGMHLCKVYLEILLPGSCGQVLFPKTFYLTIIEWQILA